MLKRNKTMVRLVLVTALLAPEMAVSAVAVHSSGTVHPNVVAATVKPIDNPQITTLHREIRELRTQVAAQESTLDSVSARLNMAFGIIGAILTIFLGALANKLVTRLFQRPAELDAEKSHKPKVDGRRPHPQPSAA